MLEVLDQLLEVEVLHQVLELELVTKFSVESVMETGVGNTGMDEDDVTLLLWRNSTCSAPSSKFPFILG